MMDSDRTRGTSAKLTLNVRKFQTLWSAWIAVRTKALYSKNRKTAEDAARIEQNPARSIRALHEALRAGTFEFSLQKGVLKTRSGKDPRPIVVSPVMNRIVQRAILDTLQSESPSLKSRLGAIPETLRTPTSVGGIPGRGAQSAVRLIQGAVEGGGRHFIRSDIRDFFTRVPTGQVIEFVRAQTREDQFADLIVRGLRVELENADDPLVREWLSLFPDGEIGVPQGSSLSAFCANVVLAEFDAALNDRGITMVRYIDDFVILGPNQRAVNKAWERGLKILNGLGLEAHTPRRGGAKASFGDSADGFDFLSFHFRGCQVGVSRDAKQRLIQEVRGDLSKARRDIGRSTKLPRRAEPRFAQALVAVDRKVRGWGDSFRIVDQRVQFSQVDEVISDEVERFIRWYVRQSAEAPSGERMRSLGVALLADTPSGWSEN
ncbi:Retron-type reverse transcriptase [Albimonas donghaensis]|uniref:Retron-type reverse transcriptase n=1 Tax=Albimonas donghaensis TaxID=356660 RepID=A0A1H3CLP7_9RHOB|nr:reverse transcriptase domain-containing protein [Albimonas donghaensis]SDX55006.1 Retron-type reverse transcriptase [Albimonas donghaensis]